MSHPQNNGGTWDVHCSVAVSNTLKELQHEATLQGRGELVLAALRQIIHRLKHDPDGLGEPLYRLPALRMQIRSGIIPPLAVLFGVCEDRPIVFIRRVRLMA
jgi:hypothetical protein